MFVHVYNTKLLPTQYVTLMTASGCMPRLYTWLASPGSKYLPRPSMRSNQLDRCVIAEVVKPRSAPCAHAAWQHVAKKLRHILNLTVSTSNCTAKLPCPKKLISVSARMQDALAHWAMPRVTQCIEQYFSMRGRNPITMLSGRSLSSST